MDLRLAGRAVCVTGGTRGIGRAVVRGLLDEGAGVAVLARGAHGLEELREQVGDAADRLLLHRGDAERRADVEGVLAAAVDAFGGLDGVVANAGAGTTGRVLEAEPDEYARQFDVKVTAVHTLVRAALPHLRRSSAPRIVVVNGAGARHPDPQMAAVAAARGALANVVTLLAAQLAPEGVLVNAVDPGAIATDRQRERHRRSRSELDFDEWLVREAAERGIPLGRLGSPQEVAPWVLMFLSPLASYATGAHLDVSGGLTLP